MKGAGAHRFWAFLLVTAQVAMLGSMSGLWPFPVVIWLVAFIGLPGRKQFSFSSQTRQILGLVLGAVFLAKSQMIPVELYPFSGRGLPFGYSYAIAQMCLTLQVSQFFLKYPNDRLPFFIAPLGCIVMAFGGNLREARGIISNAETHEIYRVIVFSYTLLLACYLSDIGRWRRGASSLMYDVFRLFSFCVCLGAVCGLAWGASNIVPQAEKVAVSVLSRIQTPGLAASNIPGFSNRSALGSINNWKSNSENKPVLRVVSEEVPGYLRAQSYTTCMDSEWTNNAAKVILPPRSAIPEGLPERGFGEEFFDLRMAMSWMGKGRQQEWTEMTVRHCEGPSSDIFTPLGVEYVMASSNRMSVYDTGVLESEEVILNGSYRVFTPSAPDYNSLSGGSAITQDLREKCLQLPSNLSPEVEALADRVFVGCETTMEKLIAVQQYFHLSYLYDIGIQVPEGKDPLTYFLLEKPSAHCEYFASGAALLLRLAGVPCRYVGGFVTKERNGWGGYWMARNRDAHAWVEAYDEVLGWKVVEATPSEGVPHSGGAESASFASQVGDMFKDWWLRLKSAFLGGGIKRVILRFFNLLALFIGWAITQPVVIIVVLFVATCYLYRWFHRRKRAMGATDEVDPGVLALRSLLDEMDRRLEAVGIIRRDAETIHQFSCRLDSTVSDVSFFQDAANWYTCYGDARYGLSNLSGAADHLSAIMPQKDSPSAL